MIDIMPRSWFQPRIVLVVAWPLVAAVGGTGTGCAAKVEAKIAHEEAAAPALTYRTQIDSTRLRRGTGLSAVASVTTLVEDGLSRFFRVRSSQVANSDASRELVAESPAPGWGVRATIEQRPDDFCLVTLEAVSLPAAGPPMATAQAPYSVHFGMHAVRSALAALRQVAWPVLSQETFDVLRKQATALAQSGEDPPIDEATFAHAPRPLQRADDPPRYYAPPQEGSTLRHEP
jgi:hypothetical protein